MINEHETQITFYWYQISLQETFIIHTQIVPTDRLREPDYLKVLVLAQDFCVFETKKSPDMRIWRFLVSMFFTDKSNPLRIRPLPWQLLFLRGWPIRQETGLCACRRL